MKGVDFVSYYSVNVVFCFTLLFFSETVKIKVGITLIKTVSLDEKDETLKLMMLFEQVSFHQGMFRILKCQ